MSAVIFGDTPGTVAVLTAGRAMPGSVALRPGHEPGQKFSDVFVSGKVIITGMGLAQATRVQMQQTLGDAIYVTTFADRPGDVQVSGVGFSTRCQGGEVTNAGLHGIEDLLRYYDEYKASKWKGDNLSVIEINIGKYPLSGLLLGSQVRMDSPAMGMYQFTLQISTLPGIRTELAV